MFFLYEFLFVEKFIFNYPYKTGIEYKVTIEQNISTQNNEHGKCYIRTFDFPIFRAVCFIHMFSLALFYNIFEEEKNSYFVEIF